MKKLLTLVFATLLMLSLKAQTPQLVNFQGVARNPVGNVIANRNITVRLTVQDGSAAGAPVYAETRTVTTNAFGLFTIVIGSNGATSTTGSVPGINWATGNKFLQLEIDPEGGSAFVNAGTTQLVSTPYALFAAAANPTGNAGGDLSGSYPNPTVAASAITTSKIADANVTNAKIADNAITTVKITDASITFAKIADNAVGTSKIADAAVTDAKVANGIAYSKLSGAPTSLPPSGVAGGDLTGNYPNPAVAANAITTPKIMDANITTSKIADNAVATSKIADASVTIGKLADNSVSSAKIIDGHVTTQKLADNAVFSNKIADGNVTNTKIADDAVTTTKITDANVTTPKIADAAVTDAKVANGISYSKLAGTPTSLPPSGAAGGDLTGNYPNPYVANDAITTIKIQDDNITTAKIANDAVTTNKIRIGNVTTPKLADAAVTTAKLGDNAVTTAKITDANVTTAKVADNAIVTAKVADANITTAKIADDAVVTSKITDANVTTPKIADAAVTDAKVANGISYSKLSGAPTSLPPSGTAGGDLTGSYPNPVVAADAITTTKILDANVTTAKIADNAIVTSKITDANITTAKIADDAVITSKITDANVTTPKIADAAVTDAKVANGISYSKLTGAPTSLPPSGAAGGDLTGSYPNPVVAADAITTTKILDANVTTAKIADNAIVAAKVADANITTAKIADDAVVTSKITDANVTTPKIADAAVTDAKVANGISYSKLSGAPTSLPPSGSAGGDLAGSYPNPVVAADAITTVKILDANVTTVKIADNAVITSKITDANVTTPKIADEAVTDAKVANGISYSKLLGAPTSLPPSGTAGGDLTGSYPNPVVAADAITTTKILDANVTTAKIADNAVVTSKITDANVTTPKIADAAVTDAKVANGISYSKLSGAPTSLPPSGTAGGDLTGSFPNPTVANDAITSAKILDGTIVGADISATAAIPYSKLSLTNSIQNSDLVANSVTTSKVANGTVTTSKMADSAISGLKLLTAAVQNKHIADAAVTNNKISGSGANSGDLLSYNGANVVWTSAPGATGAAGGDLIGTYPNPTVANDAITSAKIFDGTITSADISPVAAIPYSKLTLTNSVQNNDLVANSVTTSKVANGTVTTSKMADSAISGLKLLTAAVQNKHIADAAVTNNKLSGSGANNGDVLTYNGTNVVWTAAATGATGAAGGELSGTYPNPTVANDAITTAKILDGTITNADIAAAAGIPYSKLTLTNSIQNIDIVANAITTSKVANGTVTTSKMADSAISGLKLLTAAVQNKHIADAAVTNNKISGSGATTGDVLTYNGSNVVWTPAVTGATGAAGGDLSGTYPNPTVANDAITSAKIFDGTITNADISPVAAIPYSKLTLTNSVQNSDLVANSVTTSKVANGTVTTSKMADSAITGLKLLTAAVQNKHIADAAVTNNKISASGATTGDVLTYNGTSVVWTAAVTGATGAAGGDLSGTYPNPAVANDAITSAKIFDGTITNADIATAAGIPYSKLNLVNSVQNIDIVPNAITTSKVANGTVTTSKMADSAITGLKLLTAAVQNKHIADAAVTNNKISASGATTGDVLTYNGTSVVWTAAATGATGAAGGDLSGTYPNPTVANNAVTPAKISGSGATTGDVLTYNGSAVVWTAPTGGGAPTGAAGGDLSGTYPNPTVAANAITSAKIADGTITNADIIAAAGIPYSKLTLTNSIQNIDIVANAITTSKVANGTVTTSKMADSAISGLKLLTAAVQNKHIADAAVTTNKISSAGAVTGQALMFNGSSIQWGSPTVASSTPVVITNSAATPISVDFSATVSKIYMINRGGTTGAYSASITLPASSNFADGDIVTVYISNAAGGPMQPSVSIGGVTTLYSYAAAGSVDVSGAPVLLTATTTSLVRFLRVNATTWYRIL